MPSHDPYAHLRENLAVYRESHAVRTSILWCTSCGYHHADESGLCPVCRPVDRLDLAAATGEDSAGVSAA